MELKLRSKRLTAWWSSSQYIYWNFTLCQNDKSKNHDQHEASFIHDWESFFLLSVLSGQYMTGVILWFTWDGRRASLCRAVTMVTACFPLVTQVWSSAHLINNHQKAFALDRRWQSRLKDTFLKEQKNISLIVLPAPSLMINMSRRNIPLPHLNLSAWLTIHQRQAAGVHREIRHPLIKENCFNIAFWSFPIRNHHWVKRGQPKELRLELLHAPESQRGLQGETPVDVVVWYHYHLHAGGQRCLHTVGSVFKHQALGEGERENRAM